MAVNNYRTQERDLHIYYKDSAEYANCAQVLLPLMGWVRNYHAWAFMDFRDCSLFGPGKENTAIDMMHLPMHLVYTIDAAKENVTLGHLMKAKGDQLGFVYDFGDLWHHTMTLKEVIPLEASTGQVKVIDGAMQCPPEDSNGALSMKCDLWIAALLALLVHKPRSKPRGLQVMLLVRVVDRGAAHPSPPDCATPPRLVALLTVEVEQNRQ